MSDQSGQSGKPAGGWPARPPAPGLQIERDERFRVHVAVRYQAASDFVLEYAENLSRGGLFLPGAHSFPLRQQLSLEITLPGAGSAVVMAEVAHILSPEMAAKMQRKPGAGLAITKAPDDWKARLGAYLVRLGRRRDAVVMVGDDAVRAALEQAGFQVRGLVPVDALIETLARATDPIVGVVVPRHLFAAYADTLEAQGSRELVHALGGPGQSPETTSIDELLNNLDAAL